MTDEDGEHQHQGPLDRSISSSVRGNATAFGFSIMITVSFGIVNTLDGRPHIHELVLFGVAAALVVMVFEAGVTRGFRMHVDQSSQEVRLLGTALNFLSVTAGAGAAIAVGELLDGGLVWPLAATAATAAYVASESAEIYLAERIQAGRGKPHGERGEES